MRRKPNLTTLVVIGSALLLLLLGAAFQQSPEGRDAPRAGFEDAAPTGGKGLRLLLSRLDFTPKHAVEPLQKIPDDAKVWLLLDPQTHFSAREATDLTNWVKGGGTLIWCLDSWAFPSFSNLSLPGQNSGANQLRKNFGLGEASFSIPGGGLKQRPPAQPELAPWTLDAPTIYRSGVQTARGGVGNFESSRSHLEIVGTGATAIEIPLGKGRAIVFPDAWLFTNYALAQDDNAVLVSNLVRAHAESGAVYFDERQHDESGQPPVVDSLWNRLKTPPYVWALWQLFFAAILLALFTGRRLGNPTPLPDDGPVTRASQYARAMGALFQKANKPEAAAKIVGEDFRRRVAKRVGLSPSESDDLLARRASEICEVPFETFDALLLASRAPSENEARMLRDAREMERVLRILEG